MTVIDFLQHKTKRLNRKVQLFHELIDRKKATNMEQLSIQEEAVNYGKIATIEEQLKEIKKTLEIVRQPTDIVDKIKVDEIILTHYLQKELEGTLVFSESHPLYGYTVYHKMLLNHYIKLGDYEKCHEIHTM